MRQVTLTMDLIATGSSQTRMDECKKAGLDVIRYHAGVLNYHTALSLQERWVRDGHPSRFVFLKRLVSKLYTIGAIDANPIHGIRNPYMEKRKRPEITTKDYEALLEAADGHWLLPLIRGIWTTGLAYSDICSLQWKEVDIDECVITRVRQKMRTRSGGDCIIPLDPEGPFMDWLRKAHESKDLELGKYPSVNGAHYVNNEIAARYLRGHAGRTVIYREWSKLRERAGLADKDIQIHDFRAHTCTVLVNSMNLIHASQITGHKDLNVLKGYVRPDKANLKALMKTVHEGLR